MSKRVEGFPFNILTDPMYDGSTLCFASGALWQVVKDLFDLRCRFSLFECSPPRELCRYQRPAGLFITAFIYIVYGFALQYEGSVHAIHPSISHDFLIRFYFRPFTDAIYSARAKKQAEKKQ